MKITRLKRSFAVVWFANRVCVSWALLSKYNDCRAQRVIFLVCVGTLNHRIKNSVHARFRLRQENYVINILGRAWPRLRIYWMQLSMAIEWEQENCWDYTEKEMLVRGASRDISIRCVIRHCNTYFSIFDVISSRILFSCNFLLTQWFLQQTVI